MLSLTDLALEMPEADAYAQSRGHSDWLDAEASPDDARTAALRRGQDFLAGKYNSRWTVSFENDDAPDTVRFAIVEAARLELAEPGTLAPRLARGGQIKRQAEGVGPLREEVEYFGTAPAEDTISAIDNLLKAAGLIRSGSSIVGFAARA